MREDQLVDTFLNDIPLSPVPAGFTRRLMERIENEQKVPNFHLEFTDFAVPVFLALFTTLIFSAVLVVFVLIPPFWRLRLEMQLQQSLWSLPEPSFLIAAAAVCLLCITVVAALGTAGMLWLRLEGPGNGIPGLKTARRIPIRG